MKKIFKPLICLLLTVGMMLPMAASVFADIGDNIGGGSGSGAGGAIDKRYSYSSSLPQGYRVTLITKDGKRIKEPIDIVNSGKDENYAQQVKMHFGKFNKVEYIGGMSADDVKVEEEPYTYTVLPSERTNLPNFFNFDIAAIKDWFTTRENIMWLCESGKLDFEYSKLINSPDYKLFIEPLVYIKMPVSDEDTGSIVAMTSTEGTMASMADKQIAYNLPAILRRQLPISMYLEFDDTDIGVKAYKGSTNLGGSYVTNEKAFNELGMGIIYFTDPNFDEPEEPEDPDKPTQKEYSYDLIAHDVTISGIYEEENHFGVQGTYEYQQEIECYACDEHCKKCGDDGMMPKTITEESLDFKECSACGGTGWRGERECGVCKGNGMMIHSACKGTGILANGEPCMYERCSGGLLLYMTFVTTTIENGQRCDNPRCRTLCTVCDAVGAHMVQKHLHTASKIRLSPTI